MPPNLSRRVTEKSANAKQKTRFKIPLAASPARPGTSNPARSRDAKSLSSADVDRCARFAGRKKGGGGGGGGARVFFSLLFEERLFVFNDTETKKAPPSSKCEKVSAFFLFFCFFFGRKRRALFSLSFSLFFSLFFLAVDVILDSRRRRVYRTPLLRHTRVLYRSSIEQPPFLFSNTTPSSTPSRRTPARARGEVPAVLGSCTSRRSARGVNAL